MNLEAEGFRLTDGIVIPWLDVEHVDKSLKRTERGERRTCDAFSANRHKIRPLMIGPRRLARGCSYALLKRGFDSYRKDAAVKKIKRLMCYFGDSRGPQPAENAVAPDFDREADILGYFGGRITHPNEKRAKVAEYINQAGDGCDGRIVNRGFSDTGNRSEAELVIPLADFCRHIAQFQYNFNVSGYRMSIPNRFIESFMVGTAIVTDRLAVRWYKPFTVDEVFETVEMGYLPEAFVDWETFERDIAGLPETKPEKILAEFGEKWSPEAAASYMVDILTGGAGRNE